MNILFNFGSDQLIVIISLLLILFFALLVIGLINPKIITMNSRKRVLVYGVPVVFALFISGLIVAPESAPVQRAQTEQKKLEKEGITNTTNDKQENEKKNSIEVVKSEEKPKQEVEKEQSVLESSKNILYEIFKFGDDEIDETIVNIEFNESDKSLIATVKGKDGWSEKSIGEGFYMDSTAAYRELAKDKRISEVWISITFPMKDEYGNIEEEVMSTWMSRESMEKINWGNFDYKKLLDVVDGKRIYPQFVQ